MTDTNQASEDELKKRIGNLHAYNFDGDDVTVKVMVDEDILESIAKFVEAFIRTEKLKLLAEGRERVVGEDVVLDSWEIPVYEEEFVIISATQQNRLRADQRISLTKMEAEL